MNTSPADGEAREPSPGLRRQFYWRRTRALTVVLLATWFGITFCSAYFAGELNRFEFLGFPLGFYLCAQGDLLAYLLIVGLYAKYMDHFDASQSQDPESSPKAD
ncbi:MAG: DUF4212 domain-containing protein [Zoogloeaceae bacterium]|nr:DUF4212 domain-containing protein [Rhodocyclaceae bacterium]MCP5234990.1 DUF4212 domain-containing protein [Zoogloeaceae bacterium]